MFSEDCAVDDRDQVLQQALALSPEDRVFVISALEQSLPAQDAGSVNATGELLQQVQSRSAAFRESKSHSKGAAQLIAEQRRRQADEAGN